MIPPLLCAIIVGVIARWNSGSWVAAFLSVFIGGAISLLIWIFISAGFASEQQPNQFSVDLRAMNTGSEVNGSFFLGSGKIGNTRMYHYIVERSNGSLKGHSAPIHNSVIFPDATGRPHLVVTEYDKHVGRWWFYTQDRTEYAFYVPPGSVSQKIEVTP